MRTVVLQREQIQTGSLILVNARHPYREGAAKQALRPVDPKAPEVLLEEHAAAALSRLMDTLNGWEQITAVSGWRSIGEQQEIYAQSLQENGRAFTEKFVALPGHSEHQTGLAIDLALTREHIDFIRPDFPHSGIGQVFRQHMASYGFVERYPHGKEAVTGIAQEPWHFRYVGTPHAVIMERNGFVLEEYLSFLKHYPYGKRWYSYRAGPASAAISYLEANKSGNTLLTLDDCVSCAISGSNLDGYIVTMGRDER